MYVFLHFTNKSTSALPDPTVFWDTVSLCYVAMCVHCSFRGADFRPDYRAVANLRSVFSSSPFLCLSGTVTQAGIVFNMRRKAACLLEDVLDMLQLRCQDVYINALLPGHQNISVDVVYSLVLNWKNFAHTC